MFGDCNDCILVTPISSRAAAADEALPGRPVGAELCGPLMAPDERAFFCAIQHPGGNNVAGVDYGQLRWQPARRRHRTFRMAATLGRARPSS